MNTRFHWLNILLDTVALVVAVVVDLILNIICMLILAPGPLEAVGFVAIAFVVVLFAIRSWIKGNKILWLMFALVCFFFDLSFTLISTDVQTQSQATSITTASDSEFVYLTQKADAAQLALADLRAQYRTAYRRETMDELDVMIQEAQRVAADSDRARTARRQLIESGELNAQVVRQRATITAEMIFGAIPAAVVKARFIPLAVFALIFAGLQLVMVTAASAGVNKAGRRSGRPAGRPPREAPDRLRAHVDTWVHTSWIGRRNGRTTKVLDRETFMQFIANQGGTFPARVYKQIAIAARESGVIDGAGEIIERDEGQAAEKIIKHLTRAVNGDRMISETKQPNLF